MREHVYTPERVLRADRTASITCRLFAAFCTSNNATTVQSMCATQLHRIWSTYLADAAEADLCAE